MMPQHRAGMGRERRSKQARKPDMQSAGRRHRQGFGQVQPQHRPAGGPRQQQPGNRQRGQRQIQRQFVEFCRAKQEEYNLEHGITPTTIKRNIGDVLADVSMKDGLVVDTGDDETQHLVGHNLKAYIADLEEQMKKAASDLEFETSAAIRDQIRRLEMDELGLPPDARAAAAKGRATGGAAGTRTTRFSKMQKKGFSAKRRGAGR